MRLYNVIFEILTHVIIRKSSQALVLFFSLLMLIWNMLLNWIHPIICAIIFYNFCYPSKFPDTLGYHNHCRECCSQVPSILWLNLLFPNNTIWLAGIYCFAEEIDLWWNMLLRCWNKEASGYNLLHKFWS